jgi:hypothetical protein
MNDELREDIEGSGVFMEGVRKITKNLSQNSRYCGRDLIYSSREYEFGALPLYTRCVLPFVASEGSLPCSQQPDGDINKR